MLLGLLCVDYLVNLYRMTNLLTLDEAALSTGMSRFTLYKMAKSGRLKSEWDGGRIVVDIRELGKLVACGALKPRRKRVAA